MDLPFSLNDYIYIYIYTIRASLALYFASMQLQEDYYNKYRKNDRDSTLVTPVTTVSSGVENIVRQNYTV